MDPESQGNNVNPPTHDPTPFTPEQAATTSLRAGEVFKPTPVSQRKFFSGRISQLQTVHDAILQTGQHVAMYGERGVGKTSLANILRPVFTDLGKPRLVIKTNATVKDTFGSLWRKAFQETTWTEASQTAGFAPTAVMKPTNLATHFKLPDEPTADDVRRCLAQVRSSVWVFDEFDRLQREHARIFTDLIKMLSGYEVPVTVIMVGVSETVELLVRDHKSIVRSLVEVNMPRMSHDELRAILLTGAEEIGMRFSPDALNRVIRLSQGLPHFTHSIGLHAVRAACMRRSREVTTDDISSGLTVAVARSDETISAKYLKATHSAHRDALYRHVVLACALAETDDHGWFQLARVVPPLARITKKKDVAIANFSRHISEMCRKERGAILCQIGEMRRRRYRFRDPMMPVYSVIRSISDGLVDDGVLQSIDRDHVDCEALWTRDQID